MKLNIHINEFAYIERILNIRYKNTELIDLTYHEFKANIKRDVDATEIIENFEFDLTNILTGQVKIYLTDTQCRTIGDYQWDWDNYPVIYDLIMRNIITGKITKLLDGNLYLNKGVTEW